MILGMTRQKTLGVIGVGQERAKPGDLRTRLIACPRRNGAARKVIQRVHNEAEIAYSCIPDFTCGGLSGRRSQYGCGSEMKLIAYPFFFLMNQLQE